MQNNFKRNDGSYINQREVIFGNQGVDTGVDKDFYGVVPQGEIIEVTKRLCQIPSDLKGKYKVSNSCVLAIWQYYYVQFSAKGKYEEYLKKNERWYWSPKAILADFPFMFKNATQVSGVRKRLEQIGVFKIMDDDTIFFDRNIRHENLPDEDRKIVVAGDVEITKADIKREVLRELANGELVEKEITEEIVESTARYLAELEERREKEKICDTTGLTEEEMWDLL